MLRFLAYLCSYVLHPLSYLVPRDARKYAFGCPRGGFEGNPKYLFIRLAEAGRDVVWISANPQTVERVKSLGLRAEKVTSAKGMWRALRSGTWFVGAYSSDILWALSGGARVVDLWHGVGLKRTEFNSTSGPMYDRYIRRTAKEVFYHPEAFRKPELLVTASDFQTPMFSSAFRIPESRCLKCTYPRNRILTCSEEERTRHITSYESGRTAQLVEMLKGCTGKVYIYMPTWRDSQKDIFTQGMDLERLSSILSAHGDTLILKPHYNTKAAAGKDLPGIITLPPDTDVYPLLPYTDCLITDYSSILYDYILMPGKSVVLYLYDYDEYVKDREFYFPFDRNVIGQRAGSKDELEAIIEKGSQPLDEAERKSLCDRFWGKENERHDICDSLHI